MAFDISKFIGKFTAEARDHIIKMNQFLLDFEKNPDDIDLLNQVFRSAHTIKGSSKILSLTPISGLAHKLEDTLDALRNGEILPSKELFSLIFQSVDAVSVMVDQIEAGKTCDEGDPQLLENLERAVEGELDGEKLSPEQTLTEPKDIKPLEPSTTSEADSKESTQVEPSPDSPKTTKKPQESLADKSIKVPTQKLDDSIKMMGEIVSNHSQMKQGLIDLEEIQKIFKKYLVHATHLETSGDQESEHSNLAQLLQAKLKAHFLNMRDTLNIQGLLTENLRDKVLQLRMLPISTAIETFPRMVRDLSNSLGKEVDFIIEGGETEMDKRIIEKIGDPLQHMIRNAIDHGFENPDERVAKNKPRKGTLKLAASYEGGNVLIEISDDGGGIPIAKIKEKALKQNLFTKDELAGFSTPEIANLIFEPGFSTSPIITNTSGRGVGMDVVKASIVELLKGSIQTQTTQDLGTCFTIRLPLTLAIMRVLLFSISNTLFAFPISSIREIIRVPRDEMIDVVNKKAVRVREQIIPVTEMSDLIQLPGTVHQNSNDAIILLLAMGSEIIGVIIDHLISEEDMEVKSLPSHMRNSDLASGATITGRGDVVILLHVPKVFERSKKVQSSQSSISPSIETKKDQHILVVEDSISTREIEKSILESYGYKVDTASDGMEGLEKSKNFQYDLVITDIDMPRLDGFGLTERLRQDDNYRHTPIIIVSSREKEEDKRRGINVGADAFITKGAFDQSSLVSTIQNLI